MTSPTENPPAKNRPSISETFGLDTYRFTKGKLLLLGAATLMVTLGVALAWTAPKKTPSPAPAKPTSTNAAAPNNLLANSFAESQPGPDDSQATPPPSDTFGLPDLSTFLVKGGFGAFIGFAIGFAIRAFIRLAMVIVGFYLLTLTLMSYAGWVEIHWAVMETHFNHAVTTLGKQFNSFKAFLTGTIPASSMTALGLALGLRKR